MATRQLWIISLVLCSALPSTTVVNWELTRPSKLQAYRHDCVIINCTFKYNNCTDLSTPEIGIWKKNGKEGNLYHTTPANVDSAFRNRTELLGDVRDKNCTLKINHLRETDSGQYIFRVEGKTTKGGICHYTYKEQPVTLEVHTNGTRPVIAMDEVKIGSLATVMCSIKYTCLTNTPDLNWSHEQRGNYSTVQNRHGDQWILTSNLTFLTQDSDLDTMINCTAKYNQSSAGYEEERESILLQLVYPPRITKESTCSKTQCVCVVDSRPPSVIKWILPDQSVISNISAEEYKVKYELNISDVNARLVYCEAINHYGKATVSFSLGVPVLYIVIGVFAVLLIILLAAIFFMRRFRRQQAKMNILCLMPNPLYKTSEETQNPIKHDAPRRPAPAVPEMSTGMEDSGDDDYIIPEDDGAYPYANRDSLASAIPSRRSQSRKSKRQSTAMTLADSYYIPEEMEVPRVEEVDEGIYSNVDCDIYANYENSI